MVLKGKIRGNGRQLAGYLLSMKENEQVRILDVDGMATFSERDFRDLLSDMSRAEQLTKSRQGIYHGIINPDEDESYRMGDEDWLAAAEIFADELGFSGQAKAIVLHEKKGRIHAHLVMSRYDVQKQKMVPIDHDYRKQDQARLKMEEVFRHKQTPKRNLHRPEMKARLSALWREAKSAGDFIREARQQGYIISKGYQRMPFMVVDQSGRSFNLLRHLDGVKTGEVRERFSDTTLMGEKDAIAFARTRQATTGRKSIDKTTAPGLQGVQMKSDEALPGKEKTTREDFIENLTKLREKQQAQRQRGPRPR